MTKRILLLPLLVLSFFAKAQDSLSHRLILIGDAGEPGKQQNGVLTNAASRIIKGKTTVFFLGDNIYPTGMGLPGSPEEDSTKKIIQAQFKPMRAAGAPVFFVPGNHDWDRMGPKGLAKIKREGEFLKEQKDSLLRLIPENGCPGPYELDINENLTVIAFDSEWWVYIFNKDNAAADCDCNTNDEIIYRFNEMLYKNRKKIIILADHHPFKTYGHHGDSYIWQDYVFPLTSVNSKLYIPFPVIGAIYPLVRGTFDVPEDIGHPLYRTMKARILSVFGQDPNVIYASGHEHGLQFINDDGITQVVSGSGAKKAVVKKGKGSLYAQSVAGYVVVDVMKDKSTKFTYYSPEADTVFKQVFSYTKPYTKIKIPVEKVYTGVKTDSVKISARPELDSVSRIHRWLYGENYRKEWAAPTTLPVIRISKFKGGLTPVRFGGAHQTQSLLLTDTAGKEWVMSNIQRYPRIDLPASIRQTFAQAWLKDAISAQYPYGAVMTAVLAKAVNVASTQPTIGWIAHDKKLGFYEKDFAGSICMIEEREPNDSSINTSQLIQLLDKDYNNRLDSTDFLKARLLDWFIGDWDRHQDNWRWIGTKVGDATYFRSLPRDRYESFYVNMGLIPKAASRQWVAPYLKGYAGGPKGISDFYVNDHVLNTRFMTSISYERWMELATDFQNELTDEVLENSLKKLPPEIYRLRHDEMLSLMKKRRDKILLAADDYFRFFNRRVDIKATDKTEVVSITDTLDGGMTVCIRKPGKNTYQNILFKRSFDPKITREIRLYVSKGNDSVYVNTKSKIILRIVGGDGSKYYHVENAGRKVNIYEKYNTTGFKNVSVAHIDETISKDTTNLAYTATNLYNTVVPLLVMGNNVDNGYYIDGGFRYLIQGFRRDPANVQQFLVGHSFGSDATRLSYLGDWNTAIKKADIEVSAKAFVPNSINFFGRGNETPYIKTGDYADYYRVRFQYYTLDAALRFKNLAGVTSIRIGPSIQYYHYAPDEINRLVNNSRLMHTYDSTTITKDKLQAGLVINYINDKRNNATFPDWGVYVNVKMMGYTGFNSYTKAYAQFLGNAELYKSVDLKSNFVIAEKVGVGITAGKTTYYQSLFLGGEEHLIGYKEDRFAGQHLLYNNLEARLKLGELLPYIQPGQFGITAFYDVGRVWVKQEPSAVWHNGVGAGAYFWPSNMALLQFKMGYSSEGWYPYINLRLTF